MKRVYVHSNDSEKPTTILLIRAFVEEQKKGEKEKEDKTASLFKATSDVKWQFKLFGYPRYTYR